MDRFRTRLSFPLCGLIAVLSALPLSTSALALDPLVAARRADQFLAKELYGGTAEGAPDAPAQPSAATDDATFLRRVSLDLVGATPTPEELTAYSLDLSENKRANAVKRLLAKPAFGQNWARYWRDVVMYRRSEERGLLASPAMVEFLTDAFNNTPHWNRIAHQFITATGDVRERGDTALIMAQMGNAEDTTAEVSRIFMGIQIQCAQCHHHPTDRWKREQFHELAAFFPRIGVRPVRDGEQRSFAVMSVDRERGKDKKDKPGRGSLEHRMPDLKNPDDEGKVMRPVFFVTGQRLETGLSDAERRNHIADWITADKNPWFARAFVNRIWSEMVGTGFYEPVDDIGPDRKCSAPRTLDYLSDQFAANQYDVKWLFSAIAATEAYGRESRSRVNDGAAPFTSACPQRLRGDQLFNTLVTVLGIPEEQGGRNKDGKNYRAMLGSPRARVNQTFGYDPSAPRDEIAGSIPQALFLMNAPELGNAMNAKRPGTSIGQLLNQVPKNEDLVAELYLRCLAREPKPTELQTCLEHVQATSSRAEAFEDILWALVNSTEFLNRK